MQSFCHGVLQHSPAFRPAGLQRAGGGSAEWHHQWDEPEADPVSEFSAWIGSRPDQLSALASVPMRSRIPKHASLARQAGCLHTGTRRRSKINDPNEPPYYPMPI